MAAMISIAVEIDPHKTEGQGSVCSAAVSLLFPSSMAGWLTPGQLAGQCSSTKWLEIAAVLPISPGQMLELGCEGWAANF